jgi:GT2 family glycosyltransferase
VDQASEDGTTASVRASFPNVQVLENETNNGFAGGNNLGIEQALAEGAQYVFLLNNDTTVAPDLIERLVVRAESDAQIGIVGALMLYHGEPEVVWSAGGSLGEDGGATMLRQGERADAIPTEPFEVDYVVGCGLLVKRAVLEKVGLLDERYFLYYEETDFCARVQKAGWRIVTEPTARLWHKVSRTTGAESDLTLYYMRRNVLLYLREHGRRPILSVARAVGDALRLALVWTLQGKHHRRKVLLRAVRDFFRNRTGKAEITFP